MCPGIILAAGRSPPKMGRVEGNDLQAGHLVLIHSPVVAQIFFAEMKHSFEATRIRNLDLPTFQSKVWGNLIYLYLLVTHTLDGSSSYADLSKSHHGVHAFQKTQRANRESIHTGTGNVHIYETRNTQTIWKYIHSIYVFHIYRHIFVYIY